MFCGKHQLYEWLLSKKVVPKTVSDLLIAKGSIWVLGALTGLSLFVEEKNRRAELAMYVMPKGLESAWIVARGKGMVMKTGEFGESLVCLHNISVLPLLKFSQFAAVAMGMVMVSSGAVFLNQS